MPSRMSNERAVGHLVDPDEAETINVLGPTIQFLTPPEGEHAPCIMRGSIPPAGFVPMHSHADPETFMLLSGSVEGLVYEDENFRWVRINPRDVFYVPGDAKHAWRNPGREPAVMLVISTARIGRFFREIGKPAVSGAPAVPPSPEDIARFLMLSDRYGYWNASPEENRRVGLPVT